MARANRHHIPGQVWHITHRCHKREFLLKFARDRERWLQWLFEAKQRFGLQVLNYTVTCNHIHLLVRDHRDDVIPRSIQLVAGQTAQEYNRRKARKGAFWEDRYHATAVESGSHLLRCLVYIDLNMVRNGVVTHPSAWRHGGYNEIQSPPKRYRLISRETLLACCDVGSDAELAVRHRDWVEETLNSPRNVRQPEWTEALAVGSEGFVNGVLETLGVRARGRRVRQGAGHSMVKEPQACYGPVSGPENEALTLDNGFFWTRMALESGA
jgi:REP element-mobilizing transposase RayT